MAEFLILEIYFIVSLFTSICLFLLHYTLQLKYKNNKKWNNILLFILIFGCTARWYCISVSFTLFNKWFLNIWNGGFKFPIIYTSIHMCMKYLLSFIYITITKTKVEKMEWIDIITIALPIGVATALDVMLSNYSLLYVSITLYTIIKASILIWTFIFGVLVKIEPFYLLTFISITVIFIGISLAVFTSTDISYFGIILVLFAAMSGGIRWVLIQKLISHTKSMNLIQSIYYFAPYSVIFILPFSIWMEVIPFFSSDYYLNNDSKTLLLTLLFTLCGGFIAFYLIYIEIKLVSLTSSLTLGVLGQVKEILQILLSIIVYHDQVNLYNGIGIVISMIGIAWYKQLKYKQHLENEKDVQYSVLNQVESELNVFDENDVFDSQLELTNYPDDNDD